MTTVLHLVVRRVGGDQSAIKDDEPLRRQLTQRGLERGGVLGQEVDGLGHVPADGRGGDPEPGCHLGKRLVHAQVYQREQGLVEAAQPTPAGVQFTPSGADQPGNVLDHLVGDVEHGTLRDQRGSCGEC